jgi:hypothetical protein
MTEDDTFKKLRQVPYKSVSAQIATMARTPGAVKDIIAFLKSSGWGEDEYLAEFERRIDDHEW